MSPKYRRQNRIVCDLVLIFSQNQRLFFLENKLYRSPSFNKRYGLYCESEGSGRSHVRNRSLQVVMRTERENGPRGNLLRPN